MLDLLKKAIWKLNLCELTDSTLHLITSRCLRKEPVVGGTKTGLKKKVEIEPNS